MARRGAARYGGARDTRCYADDVTSYAALLLDALRRVYYAGIRCHSVIVTR